MKKKKSIISMVFVLSLLVFTLYGCSSKEDSYNNQSVKDSGEYASEAKEESGTEDMFTSQESPSEDSLELSTRDKIIYRINLELETKNFDVLIEDIYQQIALLNGYIESSEVSGRRYYETEQYRYGYVVARIPQNELNNFTTIVGEKANVIRKSSSSENVTLQYIDADSHKKTLQIEYDRLLEIMDQSNKLEDIIALESRLSSIRYELQNYESQLRRLDDLVTYSTVTLQINEVDRMSVVSDAKVSVFGRIKEGFSKSIYDIWEGLKNLFVWFVINLPHLIIWGGILTIVFYVINKIRKNSNNKRRNHDTDTRINESNQKIFDQNKEE